MRNWLWLLGAVFVVGVIYPPAAAAIACASVTAATVALLLLWINSHTDS